MSEITDLPSDWRDNEEPVPSLERRERIMKALQLASLGRSRMAGIRAMADAAIAVLDAEADARVETMRERCAKIADDRSNWRAGAHAPPGFDVLNRGKNHNARDIATAIRAIPTKGSPTCQ